MRLARESTTIYFDINDANMDNTRIGEKEPTTQIVHGSDNQ
jgi:hypothetical protein